MSILASILGWFIKAPVVEKPKPIEYVISEQHFKSLESAISARFVQVETRMAKIEGHYGEVIGNLKKDLREADKEIEALEEERAALTDEVARREELIKVAPQALEQMQFAPDQKDQIMAYLLDAQNQETIDNLIAKYLPGVPITVANILPLAPVLRMALSSMVPQKKPQTEPEEAQVFK